MKILLLFLALTGLTPAEKEEQRAAQLRAEALTKTGELEQAAEELGRLSELDPANEELILDRAEILEETGDWPEAMRLYDSILDKDRKASRRATERAYERRNALRDERGNAFGLELDQRSFTGDRITRGNPWARYFLGRRTAIVADGVFGRYSISDPGVRDRRTRDVNEAGLGIWQDFGANVRLGIFGRQHFRPSTDQTSFGAEGRAHFGKGSLRLRAEKDRLWIEPAEAVFRDGTLDVVEGEFSFALGERWAVSADGEWKEYHIFSGQTFGDEKRGAATLSYTLIRNDYGAAGPLRSLTVSGGYERSEASQDNQYRAVISLVPQTSILSVGADLHLLFGGPTSVTLGGRVGHDDERRLGFGDIYTLHAALETDLSERTSLFLDGAYNSESSIDAEGGAYRQIRAGINYYFAGAGE